MTKQKILHLTQATGGVKTYVAHVLEHADPEQFEFVIVAPPDELFEEFCRERSVKYYKVDLERGINPISSMVVLAKIVRAIKKEQPCLIHAHSAKGGFLGRVAGKLTGARVIYTPHAFSYLSFSGLKRTFFYGLEYMTRGWTTLLLAISHTEANVGLHELAYPQERIITILNSVPIPDEPCPLRIGQVVNIRMIGRLTRQKNPMLFMQIAEHLSKTHPHLRFSILGAGIHDDLKKEIDCFIAQHQLGDVVKIEKWGNAETGRRFLEEADIYVSTSAFEGLPFALLEAMLCGLPCVVSKVNGNTDVIHNGENGFACLHWEDFCVRIEQLIFNQNLRLKMGMNAYKYVKDRHNITTNIKDLESLYQTI